MPPGKIAKMQFSQAGIMIISSIQALYLFNSGAIMLEFPQFGMAGKRGVIHRRKSREKVAKKRKKVKNYLLKCGRIKVPSKTLLNKKEGNSS